MHPLGASRNWTDLQYSCRPCTTWLYNTQHIILFYCTYIWDQNYSTVKSSMIDFKRKRVFVETAVKVAFGSSIWRHKRVHKCSFFLNGNMAFMYVVKLKKDAVLAKRPWKICLGRCGQDVLTCTLSRPVWVNAQRNWQMVSSTRNTYLRALFPAQLNSEKQTKKRRKNVYGICIVWHATHRHTHTFTPSHLASCCAPLSRSSTFLNNLPSGRICSTIACMQVDEYLNV